MKKLLSLFLILLLSTSNLFAGTLEIDWMEGLTSDANAQAAYVTNDTYDAYTKTASHFDGADAATAYTDPVAGAYTFVGNAQLDTAQTKFGSASLLLDGTGDYLTLADSANWAMGSGDFTVDCWIKKNADGVTGYIWGRGSAAGIEVFALRTNSGNTLTFYFRNDVPAGQEMTTTSTITGTAWHHIASIRNGNTVKVYIDGIADATTLDVTGKTMITDDTTFSVGRFGAYDGLYFNGWNDELRISKGIARWTANFTPPVSPYPNELLAYSEATIKTQGSYALKAVATTAAVNKTLTKTFATNHDLTGVKNLQFDIYSSRTGSNIKLGIHDTGGTTTEITPNVITANTQQKVNFDLSAVSDANKNAVDTLTLTQVNADSATTWYLDYFEIAQAIDVFGWVN